MVCKNYLKNKIWVADVHTVVEWFAGSCCKFFYLLWLRSVTIWKINIVPSLDCLQYKFVYDFGNYSEKTTTCKLLYDPAQHQKNIADKIYNYCRPFKQF